MQCTMWMPGVGCLWEWSIFVIKRTIIHKITIKYIKGAVLVNKKKSIVIITTFIIITLCVGLLGYKFIQNEINQNNRINELQNDISLLKAELKEQNNSTRANYSDTLFNYVAIGNSITKHSINDYWWNEVGMAATSREKDYVHLITSHLEDLYGDVCMNALNYSVWEMQATDRAETYQLLDYYLDNRLNLVTIQLSENVNDMATYETDFEELIRYIQECAPNAQIIVIDDFWNSDDKSNLKEKAAQNTGVDFVSLSEIKGKQEYQCGMGTTVYDSDGQEHIVDHEGVALHPNDKGMKYIADAVISVIE